MQLRRLGKTELQVSHLSIGGLYTSSLAGGTSETHRILKRAIELGINYVDTAPAYADSEATVGAALQGIDSPIILATKLGGRPQPFRPQDPTGLIRSVDESLRLLGREHIDVLFIHEPDRPQQYAWWTRYEPLEGPVLEVMDQLKRAGKIRHTGLAGTTVIELSRLVEWGSFDAVLTAFNYNALFREAELSVMKSAQAKDLGIVAASIYGQGFLTKRSDEELTHRPIWLSDARARQIKAYYQLLDDAGMQAQELCLRFVLGNPNIATIPIGCKTVAHLEESVRIAEKGPLPHDIAVRLDEIAAMLPYRPYEEPMILPFGKSYCGPGIANMGAAVQVGKLEL